VRAGADTAHATVGLSDHADVALCLRDGRSQSLQLGVVARALFSIFQTTTRGPTLIAAPFVARRRSIPPVPVIPVPRFPSYSAIGPEEVPNGPIRRTLPSSDSLNEDQAKSRIEAKGYSNLSGLQKDNRGIWRGKATMKDGRSVAVILDLAGNIYSELYPFIYIRPLDPHRL